MPLLCSKSDQGNIGGSWSIWDRRCHQAIDKMNDLEKKNDYLFAKAYQLSKELEASVSEYQIMLTHPKQEEDIKRLIS